MVVMSMFACGGHTKFGSEEADTIALAACPQFSSDSAYQYILDQCAYGPRVPGTPAAEACGDYIVERFRQFGALVEEQKTMVTIYDGRELPCRNIIARINPDNLDRILLCAHWDSRAWADNDPDEKHHNTPVLGANDGASGVAVLMEICRLLQQQPIQTGIDIVCFDVEDMGTPQWAETGEDTQDTWCLGSRYWAEQARANRYQARFGILLDMVGGCGSRFSREMISMQYAGPVVELVWHLAAQLGYGHYFPLQDGGYLIDDHVHVNRIARIPCLDIVPNFTEGPSSFGPTWHTVQDTPENIDINVLDAVGQTLIQLLYNDNAEQE